MKIKVLFLVFAMIFTMIVPAHANTAFPQENLLQTEEYYGKYVVSVKKGDAWNEVGSLSFCKYQTKQTIDIGDYLTDENTTVKLSQSGGGSAYLDAVLLDEKPAISINDNNEKVLNKLSKEDLDITPVGEEGVILEFSTSESSKLTVVGRIEPVVIGKEPLQFPAANNYKAKDDIKDFYTYMLDSNLYTVKADGVLDEIKSMEPFAKEYTVPGSGHPAGDTYFWVMNDNKNLYVIIDATPDNTFDGDKDYAKVYVNTDNGIKEFRISVPETTWGNTGFTYTDKVDYEHKVYEFAIPLSEVNAIKGEEISLAFVIYGTASLTFNFFGPDLAYDEKNDIYFSVFPIYKDSTYDPFDSKTIYGQLIDSEGELIEQLIDEDGEIISLKQYDRNKGEIYTGFSICDEGLNSFATLQEPSIAYDNFNKCFLLTWSQNYMVDGEEFFDIYAKTVKINKVEDTYQIIRGESFPVSEVIENNIVEKHYACNPKVACDSLNNRFLIVWSQYNNNDNGFDIYGQIVSGEKLIGNKIEICKDANDQVFPNISYSSGHEKFLVAWSGWYGDDFGTYAQIVGDDGEVDESAIIRISENGSNPNVYINDSNARFLVTWEESGEILGNYLSLSKSVLSLNDNINITPNDYNYGYYPSSYYDGKTNMLCVWASSIPARSIDFHPQARLNYVDASGKPGEPFYTEDSDSIHYGTPIAITGNYKGQFLIAYVIMGYNAIGYRLIGEPPVFEAHLEFGEKEYSVEEGDTENVTVWFYSGLNMEPVDVTDKVVYEYDSDYIEVDENGTITGIKQGSTTLKATYEDSESPAETTIIVTKRDSKEPSLSFVPDSYSLNIGTTKQTFVELKNYGELNNEHISYKAGNDTIATITSGGAITGVSKGSTTISAIYNDGEIILQATAKVTVTAPPPPYSGSSAPIRTPIGEISVNGKVIKTLYEEDAVFKNNAYTFTADKEGDKDKIWIDSSFYKELAKDNPTGKINFVCDKGTYTLPLNCKEVLNEIGSMAKKIIVSIEKVNDKDIIKAANVSAGSMGGEVISDLIDFSVFVEKTSGNKEINSLDFYAVRTVKGFNVTNKNISTTMKFVEDKKLLTFAPSVFDKSTATIKYRGNGIFTVIENTKSFNDIENHWAKMNIEKLAARNIAFGRQNNQFAPNDFVTRAEFAVMITRALGITEEEGTNSFKDVANEWFAEDINTAFEAGLINGRNDGKFYPNEKILRKDMAVMINNALKFADKEVEISNIEKLLSIFNDSSIIDDYAKESTAVCINTGIIMGRDTKDFDPDENATRAEASAIIERMLRYLEFID